ncbi:hypothetical protein [Nonomuraea gerenzanensis]|uniref:hypothetical protein n=1 Tax=Nonomuraea gerenzanensis TaxID=93944 RepID=UPI001CD93E8D|nr:hypothetical protein [Nonomuraea gerenzanensis]UBU18670.1 hypothetical protein LCN96_27745 [Nonomuraea gerenzanensis]
MSGSIFLDTLVRGSARLAECRVGVGEVCADPGGDVRRAVVMSAGAAAALLERPAPPPGRSGEALVEVALSGTAPEADWARALRLMGLDPHTPPRVAALTPAHDVSARALSDGGVRSACLGDLRAVLFCPPPPAHNRPLGFPLGTTAGRLRLHLALVLRHPRPPLNAVTPPASGVQARPAMIPRRRSPHPVRTGDA